MALAPITPTEAVEQYLNHRKSDAAKSTIQNHRYRLKRFLEWCEAVGFENMNEMTGRLAHEYQLWRRDNHDIKSVTLAQQIRTFRKLLRFCESIDAVRDGVAEKVMVPDASDGEPRDEVIDPDSATELLDYLATYEYATFRHCLFYLLWHTGLRGGSVRALDLGDFKSAERLLEVRHRPETNTPLKNKDDGQRNLTLKSNLCQVLDDYIALKRYDVTDDNGRRPLLTTQHGRPAKTNMRAQINSLTRPCVYSGKCPHDRNPDTCEAGSYQHAQKCPSSVSPHPIRRSAITYHLNQDWPKELASERMNVSQKVLDKHYDARTMEEKRSRRRRYLDNL